jgi:hypothetical protein
MMNYTKMFTDAGDQYLATISEMQENFLKARTALAAKLPAPPAAIENPFTSMLPSPQDMTDASFAFAQKLLKQQKSFAEKLLSQSTPASK